MHSEHLANTSDSRSLSDIFAFGQTINPLLENTHSTGAELAGTARMHSNIQGAGNLSGIQRPQESRPRTTAKAKDLGQKAKDSRYQG